MFFFPMAPSQGGESAERLTNTLLGAKHGGQHRQGMRIGFDEFALHEATLRLSYAKLRQYGTWQDQTICLC